MQVNPGKSLDESQVRAITHLVASSVEGLKAENVVVVDSEGNLLASGTGSDLETNMTVKDDQRAIELAYANEVQNRVQGILDKILGPNRSAVQATVEMDWTERETTSNTYSPTEVALLSSQKINESSTSGGATGGVPGAASNLPTPVATTTGTDASSYQRSEETLNYEVSQVQSHEVAAPGKVSRISVSVMVDGITDQAQLDIIKSAVEAAAGIDSTRGDQISVESFAFDRTAFDSLAAELAKQQQQELYLRIGTGVGAAIVVLALLFFILRMINNTRNASKESWRAVLRPVGEMTPLNSLPVTPQTAAAATPKLQSELTQTLSLLAEKEAASASKPSEDVVVEVGRSKGQSSSAFEDEQNARIITRLTDENPATVAEIIQLWLHESKNS
jgi:flagellar M-ring protein FliF